MKFTVYFLVIVLSLSLIAACTPAATSTPTLTPTPTPTPIPTSTDIPTLVPSSTPTPTPEPTATATKVILPWENAPMPEEWAGKIDRIETILDSQGKERVVAIAKPTGLGKEAKLRVLQWDKEKKDWVKYQFDRFYPMDVTAFWKNIKLEELPRYSLDEVVRIHYNNDEKQSEIPWGYLGSVADSKPDPGVGKNFDVVQDFYSGVFLGKSSPLPGNPTISLIFFEVPNIVGDRRVLIYYAADDCRYAATTFTLESLSENFSGKTEKEAGLISAIFNLRGCTFMKMFKNTPNVLEKRQVIVVVRRDPSMHSPQPIELVEVKTHLLEMILSGQSKNEGQGSPYLYLEDGIVLPKDLLR